jgi:hypothetical protein
MRYSVYRLAYRIKKYCYLLFLIESKHLLNQEGGNGDMQEMCKNVLISKKLFENKWGRRHKTEEKRN